MKRTITIPDDIFKKLMAHLFQNKLEQGAFLFAVADTKTESLNLEVKDIYLVPKDGWQAQRDVYLEMKDTERAKIMAIARKGGYLAIDCHSHINAKGKAWFSVSDVRGTKQFAEYVKWKLDGKPFAAMVWGESSVDAVMWHDSFDKVYTVDQVIILSSPKKILIPKGTWMEQRSFKDWRV